VSPRYPGAMRAKGALARVSVLVAAALTSSCDPAEPAPAPPPPTLIPPLHDAEVGEWLRAESGRRAQVFRVVDASDFDVTVETVTYDDGRPTSEPVTAKWSRNGFGVPSGNPPEGVIRRFERDRIEVAGKLWDCWRISIHTRLGVVWYWISEDVPVHGVLKWALVQKGQADEANAARLADYGFAEPRGK
jgi:hypothetical protein